ncbi:zinc finger BED domain-containing protein RICESLEEPER 2-like isoform X3 [Senna tora]|uniref:Zinc finger BED domain-containing protein RICESLEEPER 2-like isoform X3 n=1 Tax=Senna tora TaxID=362788 RepID=A0A834X2A1_9FABA|nr:zinc finger BED domain-containing protein RICESLEEPER 2-like isoform X3 [Senna tora]
MIREILEEIEKLIKENNRLEEKKAQLKMNKTENSKFRRGRVEKATASFISSVMQEADKMKTPQSKYIQRNKSRRHASRTSQYQTSTAHPLRVYNLRSKHAHEKSEQTPIFTPRLEVEEVRRHITYKLNQEESKILERWRCHSFGTTEGDNISFGVASMQDSGLLAINIQCLVYKGHRGLHKLWLNNRVVDLYGEILVEWANSYSNKGYADFFISPYAGVMALESLNYRDGLRWVKKLIKGYHNRLFLPCVINHHYILGVADCLKQKVIVYDSMNCGKHKKDAVKVGNWLRWVCAAVLDYEDSQCWDFMYPKDIPQQENGHDCGVFVLTYMASILMCGSIVPFSTEEICGIRDRILIELSKGQLVGF